MTALETVWEVPDPIAVHDVRVDDETVITLRRHGNPEGPRLVLSHGNGLAIDLYYPFWSLLADDFDLVVYDQRNHGWNTVTALDNHNIPTLVSDHDLIMEDIDRHFGEKPKIGVFHSFSALTTLLSRTKGSGFAARVLFDPPLCKPGRNYWDFEDAATRLASLARGRTYRFKTREQLVDLLGFLPSFGGVVPGLLELFAHTTLRESPDGQGYELRCPREYEAQIIGLCRHLCGTGRLQDAKLPDEGHRRRSHGAFLIPSEPRPKRHDDRGLRLPARNDALPPAGGAGAVR